MEKPLWENCDTYDGKFFDHVGFNGCWSCENLCKKTGEITNGVCHIVFCQKALDAMTIKSAR